MVYYVCYIQFFEIYFIGKFCICGEEEENYG